VDKDLLAEMFLMQRDLQRDFEARTGNAFATPGDEAAVRTNVTAAMVELTEILGEVNWKTWRAPRPDKPDWPRYRAEVVDLFKFAINLAVIGGMNARDLYDEFVMKDAVNVQRMEEEFGKING
jgi:hypothetical protein